MGCSPWGRTELGTSERLPLSFFLSKAETLKEMFALRDKKKDLK